MLKHLTICYSEIAPLYYTENADRNTRNIRDTSVRDTSGVLIWLL